MLELIPRPDALPVGWIWFQILLTTTWVIHILLMNALVGGAVVTLVGGLRKDGPGAVAARDAAGRVPTLVALTVNAGVAPLLFVQVLFGHLLYTSSIIMAGWWFAVIPLLIGGYYAVYAVALKYDGAARPLLSLLALLVLLFVAFMWTSNNTLAIAPERWPVYFDRPDGSFLNLAEPTVWPRWLHMIVGAVAVGGLFLALIQDRRVRAGDAAAAEARDWALRFFTHGSLAAMVVGLWWLLALPDPVMKLFMGGSIPASILLIVGIGVAVYAVVAGFLKKVRLAAALLVATVVVMAVLREIVRGGYLAGVFHPRDLAVDPQLSPLVLFLAVFVLGIGCVAYMLRLAARPAEEA
jgi:hypothetical protein